MVKDPCLDKALGRAQRGRDEGAVNVEWNDTVPCSLVTVAPVPYRLTGPEGEESRYNGVSEEWERAGEIIARYSSCRGSESHFRRARERGAYLFRISA